MAKGYPHQLATNPGIVGKPQVSTVIIAGPDRLSDASALLVLKRHRAGQVRCREMSVVCGSVNDERHTDEE
jgi:hypothetical protein